MRLRDSTKKWFGEVPDGDMDFRRDESIRKNVTFTEIGVFSAIIISLILKFRLIFLLNMDVDEFTFLANVYQYIGGTLTSPYFTFHVHLFSWLPSLSGGEVSQIIGGRVVMYFLGIGSCIFLYFISRLFLNRIGGLFSVLCYLSVSNVMVHATSFRFDPICVFLFLVAVYLILRKHHSRLPVIVAGLCMALSFLVTLKSIFYLVTMAGIFSCLFVFSGKKKDVVLDLAFFLVSFALGWIALFLFHTYTLSGVSFSVQRGYLAHLSRSDIMFHEFFPNKFYIFQAVIENLFPLGFGMAGSAIVWWEITRCRNLPENFLLLCLLVPLLTLSFYKFSFPYFYVFIISPGMAISGVLPDRIAEKYKKNGSMGLLTCLIISYVIVFSGFLYHYKYQSFDRTITQKNIVKNVHEMFPDPVPYIDRCNMISSFPMVGIQMTTWDMEKYTQANRPIMRELLVRRRPVFLLANIVHLNLSLPRGTVRDIFRVDPLLEEDFNVLRDNFVQHWGIIYVAGKRLTFEPGETAKSFENLIPGIYTIESRGDVWIDRVLYQPGSRIRMGKGTYTIAPRTTPMEVVLRWGEDLYRPRDPFPVQPVFFGYYY
jgi:hypothetical protein